MPTREQDEKRECEIREVRQTLLGRMNHDFARSHICKFVVAHDGA